MKLLYQDILKLEAPIDFIEVQSFDMCVYLVRITVGQNSGMLYGSEDKPMRFASTQEIREAFETLTVKDAVMTQQSYYDEMIGNPPGAAEPMRIPFSMSQPF